MNIGEKRAMWAFRIVILSVICWHTYRLWDQGNSWIAIVILWAVCIVAIAIGSYVGKLMRKDAFPKTDNHE